MTEDQKALREAVVKLYADKYQITDAWLADAAIAVVLEEAARVAEREGVYPELNVYNGGPEWYRHGKDIAAAIREMKSND